MSWFIVSLALVACRDVPQAPRTKSESDAALLADAADSARLTASDAKASKSAGASNTPAVISNVSLPDHALVGEPITLSLNFTDDAADSPWFVSVDWSPDDGGGRQVDSFTDPVTFSFAYATAGHYTVVVHVYDTWGADAFVTKDIDITESSSSLNTPVGDNVRVQPAATPSGTPATITYAHVSTAGNTSVSVSSFMPPHLPNLRFGSSGSVYALATSAAFAGTIQVCIAYDPASFPRSGRAHLLHETRSGWEDITTTFDASTHTVCGETLSFSNFTVALENEAPTAVVGAVGGAMEAASVQLNATANDSDNDPITYVWSFGDGSANVTTSESSVPHVYADNGSYNVTVVARDVDGLESAPATRAVVVANVAPSAVLSAPSSVNEGSSIIVSLSNPSDPSAVDQAAGFSYAFDCGSGFGVASSASSGSCPAIDNGIRVVRAKVRDKDLGERTYEATVNVLNVAPTISALNGPTSRLRKGEAATVSANYSDPGSADTHVATIDWGDGARNDLPALGGLASGSHAYSSAGTYTVSMYVTDKDGGRSATVQTTVSVSGGRKKKGIMHGEGAVIDASTSSRDKNTAAFAVFARTDADGDGVARDGALVVRSGKRTFHAKSFQTLDVDDNKGMLLGEGKFDGDVKRYGFLLAAVDGGSRRDRQKDLVRLKIWNLSTGQVVFDSEPGRGDDAVPAKRLMEGRIEVHER
jgi:PKD repeat protein